MVTPNPKYRLEHIKIVVYPLLIVKHSDAQGRHCTIYFIKEKKFEKFSTLAEITVIISNFMEECMG